MKKLYILLFSILISGLSFGQASLPIYEPFDYTVGSALGDQINWTNLNSGDEVLISAGNLSYTGLPASMGNSAVFDGAGFDPYLTYTPVTSGEVYASFILKVTDQSAMTDLTDGGYIAAIADNTTSYDARLWVRPNPDATSSTFDIGFGNVSSTPPVTPSTYNVGDDIFIVMSYDLATGNVNAWINPDSSDFGGSAPAATITGTDATIASSLSKFFLRQDSTGETPFITFDELRLSTNWADVTLGFVPPTDPTIAIFEGPSTGSTIDLSPEELSGTLEFVVTNFNVDTQGNGGDGYIVWTVINTTTSTAHDEGGPLYDFTPDPFIPLESNNSYYFVAQLISYTTSNVVAEYTLNINALGYTDVSSVAELRAVTDDGYYRLTNEAFLTFQQSFRGQKFIQDATGGILIDDNNGRISSIYDINDGITNIRGQVSEFSGMKQLIPSADYGAPSSTGNTITPQTVTLADLTANAEQYESELVKVISVIIDNSVNATFINGAEYLITQSSNNFNFRTTFYDVDYISATVPITATDIVGIVNERSGSLYYLTARNANDFSVDILSNDTFEANNFKFYPNPTSLGYVNLSSKNSARMDVAVFDILGKQVLNKTVSNNTLDVSGLTSGIYIMKVSQDNASITKKLVIQ